MRLNHECVRHMLLTAEKAGLNERVLLKRYQSYPLLSDYSEEDIIYTAERLFEAGFIDLTIAKGSRNIILSLEINSLTWEGHQFLDNVRDNAVWRESKNMASKLSSVSLDVLSKIATKVISKSLGLD